MIISAILTAAGSSRRMGSFKPMEELNGFPMVRMTAQSLLDAGVLSPVAVCAQGAAEPAGTLASMGYHIAWNAEPKDSDMLESVKIGIRALPECDAFFMLPADMPVISPKSLRALIDALMDSDADFALPVLGAKNGHPPLIRTSCAERILAHNGEKGLKGALNTLKKLTLPLSDMGLTMDADIQSELSAVRAEAKKRRGLSQALCEQILKELATPENTRAHCHVVAQKAREMTLFLNRRGFGLDSELCCSAAMLHDALKQQRKHDLCIREELERRGYLALAEITGGHMRFGENASLSDEASILILADRLVCGTEPTTPEERYREKLARFADDPMVKEIVQRDYERCLALYREYQMLEGKA